MNTIKDLAKNWFNDLDIKEYHRLSPHSNLTDEEIENIFYNEVISVWYDKLGYEQQGKLIEKYVGVLVSIEQIKEIYLKEHSKEEPTVQVMEMFDEVDGSKTFITKEDLEKIAAQPLSVKKHIEVDEEKDDSVLWYEIYSQHPITWETPAVKQVIQYIQQHYILIKKSINKAKNIKL
jgi:hypothetical protein